MSLEMRDTVTSTMDVARENVLSGRVASFGPRGPLPFAGVLARAQTQGRGQRGRVWFAPPGECLLATYYFPEEFAEPRDAGQIALIAGVAVADSLRAVFKRFPVNATVGLKWPNDALIGEKKVAGILIEMVKAPHGNWIALVGVGVNVHVRAFPDEISSLATSLRAEGATDCEIPALAEQIAEALGHEAAISREAGVSACLERWRGYDRTPGRRFLTQTENGVAQGVALGVDDAGALRIQLDDGRVMTVSAASSVKEI